MNSKQIQQLMNSQPWQDDVLSALKLALVQMKMEEEDLDVGERADAIFAAEQAIKKAEGK